MYFLVKLQSVAENSFLLFTARSDVQSQVVDKRTLVLVTVPVEHFVHCVAVLCRGDRREDVAFVAAEPFRFALRHFLVVDGEGT